MKTSDQINDLAAALAKAQGQMEAASKDSTNPHFKSKYADLASVWSVCRKPLSDNGLSVIQGAEAGDGGLLVTTRLMHASGQWMQSDLLLNPTKNDPQGVGSAITYGRRYGICAMVGIVADEDDDGNAASIPPRQQAKPVEQPPSGPPMSAEQIAFNSWVKPLVESKSITGDRVRAILGEVHGDYAKAKVNIESELQPAS